MAGIAFFDVDRTILAVNSASLWVRKELRDGRISHVAALRGALWIAAYGLGFVRMEDVLRDAVRTLAGRRERDVIDRTLEFWREEVAPTVRPGVRDAIAAHRARGDLCFLLTSSSSYLCAPIADTLALDGFLANRFVVENGVFTGEAYEPLCFGAGKVAHAAACAEKLGVRLEDCGFYTDSVSDLPMLLAAGNPAVVDPDPRLARIARARGWPIADWGVP